MRKRRENKRPVARTSARSPHAPVTRSSSRPTSRPGPTKKRTARKPMSGFTKLMVVIGIVGTVALLGGQWVLHRSIFRVQHVTITGLRHESEIDVLKASGLEAHPTMIGISASSIENNLRRFPWIHSLSIEKKWPNTLVVNVSETSPVAVAFNSQNVLQYVDQYGRDLGKAPINAPLPTLKFVNPRSGRWPYQHGGLGAAYVASQLPIAFSSQVSVITENRQGIVTLQMTTPVSFVLGPDTNLHAKFVAIASVIAHSTLRPGDVVDVTVPDELAVTGPKPVS
jgi:cell division septal protein FtsQ